MSDLGDAITRALLARKAQMDQENSNKTPEELDEDKRQKQAMFEKAKQALGFGGASSQG